MTLLQPRCNLRATSLLKPQPFLLATLQRIHRFFRRDFLHCLDLSTNACLEALHLSAELAMETANGTVQRTLTRFFRFSRILDSWNILQVIPVIPEPCSSGSIWRAVLVAQGESCKTRKHSASQLPSGVPLSKISKSPISQHRLSLSYRIHPRPTRPPRRSGLSFVRGDSLLHHSGFSTCQMLEIL